MSTRHDMLVELVSDQINSIEQMIRNDEYQDVHTWLHPILLRELKLDYADWSDADLQSYYCDQLGVDMPSSPPLSSMDAQEEIKPETFYPSPEGKFGSMSGSSHLDNLAVSLIHSICNAPRLGEMAAERPSPPASEAPVYWY